MEQEYTDWRIVQAVIYCFWIRMIILNPVIFAASSNVWETMMRQYADCCMRESSFMIPGCRLLPSLTENI